ncbi:energy transducer TonB [Halopseudomonas laoshanensis]|uniref:Energy transducer TonB n=2 Tax=Halopseudomonas TaxID=2901189 RepID=A0A7V7GSJ4_9GAMM|nr:MULTISPECIES: energy transducer TonB [Halopseudomonas]MBQ0743015.1 energy transducer TonB [Pseudomonas sp.]WOD11126.1 energy transducer TonB [Pseudomonas sp. NyZ704]KAA0693877.1 energy transducer TonB [Halopseudomonas laoshanensis]MBQ0777334.1 energy transducer TonB [Pseudomonas sp.]PCC99337.1 energy transducer TonB [Halopseudomonas pelagia]
MNKAVTPSEIAKQPDPPVVTARDRLGFTLFLAAVLHALVILGITFDLPTPSELSKTLEITLATQPSEQQPEKADYLAQMNQEGSGTLEEKAAPSTTEEAVFQDTEVNEVEPPQEASAPEPEPVREQQVVTTTAPQPDRVAKAPPTPDPVDTSVTLQRFDVTRLSQEIASLEAQLAEERQQYANRPRVHRLNAASTMQDKGAYYKDAWRRKVERIGNQNYPAEARDNSIYGSLRLLVSINRDGTLREVQVLESSGHRILDNAALRIVRLAAPYAPFTGDLMDVDVLEIIRTWRFEPGNRVSSF